MNNKLVNFIWTWKCFQTDVTTQNEYTLSCSTACTANGNTVANGITTTCCSTNNCNAVTNTGAITTCYVGGTMSQNGLSVSSAVTKTTCTSPENQYCAVRMKKKKNKCSICI